MYKAESMIKKYKTCYFMSIDKAVDILERSNFPYGASVRDLAEEGYASYFIINAYDQVWSLEEEDSYNYACTEFNVDRYTIEQTRRHHRVLLATNKDIEGAQCSCLLVPFKEVRDIIKRNYFPIPSHTVNVEMAEEYSDDFSTDLILSSDYFNDSDADDEVRTRMHILKVLSDYYNIAAVDYTVFTCDYIKNEGEGTVWIVYKKDTKADKEYDPSTVEIVEKAVRKYIQNHWSKQSLNNEPAIKEIIDTACDIYTIDQDPSSVIEPIDEFISAYEIAEDACAKYRDQCVEECMVKQDEVKTRIKNIFVKNYTIRDEEITNLLVDIAFKEYFETMRDNDFMTEEEAMQRTYQSNYTDCVSKRIHDLVKDRDIDDILLEDIENNAYELYLDEKTSSLEKAVEEALQQEERSN